MPLQLDQRLTQEKPQKENDIEVQELQTMMVLSQIQSEIIVGSTDGVVPILCSQGILFRS